METYQRLKAWLERNRDIAFELVRIYLGLGLFAKGVYFTTHVTDVLTLMEQGNIAVANVIVAHYVALAHLAGGLLLAAGLLTRLAALAQIPVLLGAVVLVHWREGLFEPGQNLEFTVLVLFLLVLVAFHGGGRLSVDARLFAADPESALEPKEHAS